MTRGRRARNWKEQEKRVVWELRCLKWQWHTLPHIPGVMNERAALAKLGALVNEAVVLQKAASQRQRRPPCFFPSSGGVVPVDFSDYTIASN